MGAATGGAAIALRYHNVYGPRMPRDTPYAGVASIFRSALERGEAPRVFEDGGQRRDFVHVGDVAAANVLALTTPRPGFVAINVGSGEPHTVARWRRGWRRDAGAGPVVAGGPASADVRHVVRQPGPRRRGAGIHRPDGVRRGMRAFATDPLRATTNP